MRNNSDVPFFGLVEKSLLAVALIAVLMAIKVGDIAAQTSTGSVRGEVSDPSGAAVPGAEIILQSGATAEKRTAVSDETGFFVFSTVLPGTYKVTATRTGFATSIIDDVIVRVGQVTAVPVPMKIGEITQEVTVTAAPVQVNSSDASLGAIVDQREATTLPILGRSFLKLATLSAGSVSGYPASWTGTFSGGRENMGVGISGAKDQVTTYLIDGTPTKSPEYGNIGYVLPLEMVDEFNIQRGFFSARYSGPGVINTASRSGTSEFHGVVWHTVRNDILNARNFFDPSEKPPLRQNQFGAAAGLPIIKEKLFVYGNWQMIRERRSSTQRGTVPTAQELSGDFSQDPVIIVDPFTKVPFTGNKIPADRIHPFAKAYQEFLSPATVPGVPFGQINRIVSSGLTQNDQNYDVKVDYIYSDKDRMFARFGYGDSSKIFPSLTDYTTTAPYVNYNATVSHTHTFSPNLINEFHFGYDRVNNQPVVPYGPGVGSRDFNAAYGIVGVNQYGACKGPAQVSMVSVSFGTFLCDLSLSNNYSYSDNIAYIRGKHTMNIGVQFTRMQVTDPIFNAQPGAFNFTGQFSGSPVSDYLLGVPFSATGLTRVKVPYRRAWQSAAYFEDTFRVNPNLSLNFGLRWELPKPAYEKYDQIQAFVPANESFLPNTPFKILLPKVDPDVAKACPQCEASSSREIVKTNYKDFSPRFGFAWKPFGNSKTSVRGSYGLFYETLVFNEYVFMSLGFPIVVPVQQISDPITPTVPITGQFGLPTLSLGGFQLSIDPDRQDPYIQQWTLSIERELPGSMLLSTAYVGSHGSHLFKRMNYNVARPGTTPLSERLPFPIFSGILQDKANGSSKYNSLQVDLVKKPSHDISFRLGYTFSRSMDSGSSQGNAYVPWDTSLDWGRSEFDIHHRFVLSFIYDLPFGKGKRLLSSSSGVVGVLVNGWQFVGIGSAQTGFEQSVYSNDNSNTLAGLFGARPNRKCSGVLPAGERTISRWFDASCFEVPPVNELGNAGQRFFDGPGFYNWDLSVIKNTRITERVTLQLRAEFFNAFNRVNFSGPNTSINSPLVGTINSAGPAREIQLAWRVIW